MGLSPFTGVSPFTGLSRTSSAGLELVGSTPGNGLLTNLTSFWEMEEATSATRNDSKGSNHLTSNGAVSQAVGKVGNAAKVTSGQGQSLSVASNASLQFGSSFEVTLWVFFEAINSNSQEIFKKYGTFGLALYHSLGTNTLNFLVYDSVISPTATTAAVSLSTWYFVDFWKDGENNRIGIALNNGTAVTASTVGLGNLNNTDPLQFVSDNFMTARIDQVGFWNNTILTPTQRGLVYNNGNGVAFSAFS